MVNIQIQTAFIDNKDRCYITDAHTDTNGRKVIYYFDAEMDGWSRNPHNATLYTREEVVKAYTDIVLPHKDEE